MAVGDRLSALEAAFLELETPEQPLHVGSLLIFEGPPPDQGTFGEHLASSVAGLAFGRRRILRMPLDLGRPWWVDASGFAVDEHLHHTVLPAPGEDEQLRDLVVRVMGSRLDPDRPPWAVWHVEGLSGGRWAVLVKAHHAVADGVAGTDLVQSILDAVPGLAARSPVAATRMPPGPSVSALVLAGLSWLLTLPLRAARLLVRTAVAPGEAVRAVRRVRRGVAQVVHPDLPPCILSGPLGRRRRWGWTGIGLGEVELVAAATGCTVNDVFLAALAGAYRTYLLARGEPVDRLVLRTIVPVSRRPAGVPATLGNRVSAMFVELPIALASPAERLAAVAQRTAEQKSHDVASSTESVVSLADHVPAPLLLRAARAYGRAGQRRVNLAATNVAGPRQPRQLMGRRLIEMVPYSPLALEVRSTAALVSCGGRLTIGVTGDADALPDLDRLVDAVGGALRELVDAARPA